MAAVQGERLVRCIEQLIRDARTGVVLISPRFDPWAGLSADIFRALRRGARVMIVVREEEPDAEGAARYFGRRGAVVRTVPGLQVLLYASERRAISTSMNLVTASASAARERGHVFDAARDRAGYRDARDRAEALVPDLGIGEVLAGRAPPGPAHGRGAR